jgi:hypothetical protein
MTAGTSYSYNFDPITILSSWNKAKLRVVVMLIDNNYNYSVPANVDQTFEESNGVEAFIEMVLCKV